MEITRLVGEIDKMMPDQPPRRIGERKRELLGEMIAERPLFGDIGFQVRRLAIRASVASKRRPVLLLEIADRRPLRVRIEVLGLGIELDGGLARIAPLQIQPIAVG